MHMQYQTAVPVNSFMTAGHLCSLYGLANAHAVSPYTGDWYAKAQTRIGRGAGRTPLPGLQGGSAEWRYFGSTIFPASMFRTSSCKSVMCPGSGRAEAPRHITHTSRANLTSSSSILLLMASLSFFGSFTATLSTLRLVCETSALWVPCLHEVPQEALRPHRLSAAQCSAKALSSALSSSQLCACQGQIIEQLNGPSRTGKQCWRHGCSSMLCCTSQNSPPPVAEHVLRNGLCWSSCWTCSWHLLVLQLCSENSAVSFLLKFSADLLSIFCACDSQRHPTLTRKLIGTPQRVSKQYHKES